MGFFSGSSKGKPYKNGHYGSKHYQRKGLFGNLINVFGSNSSRDHYPQHPDSHPGQNGNMATCAKCQEPLPKGAKFCPACGEKAAAVGFCPACGEKLTPGAKFCPGCGAKING